MEAMTGITNGMGQQTQQHQNEMPLVQQQQQQHQQHHQQPRLSTCVNQV
jgi:hypothetical protein